MTRRWRLAAYALASALCAGVASCMWGVPLPLSDNLVLMLEVQRTSLWDGLVAQSSVAGLLRPLFWAQYKILFELSRGHYYPVFQGFHVVMFAATVLLATAALRVRSASEFVGASGVLVALLGIHTFGNLVREQPITVVTCCALALWISFDEEPRWWRDVLAVANLVVAMLFVELGLLVWVIHVAAWLSGRRGIAPRTLSALSVAFVLYFVVRFLVLPAGAPQPFPRATGYGFRVLDTAALQAQFGRHPSLFYGYNIGSSILSVLFSEPRGGVFYVIRRYLAGELQPWMWNSVLTSLGFTVCIFWFVVHSRHEWRGLRFSRGHALVLVCLTVVAANAVISYPYSRDVTMSPGGLCYAVAAGPALSAIATSVSRRRPLVRASVSLLLVMLTLGWTVRTVGLMYSLRYTAFVNRNDWADADRWLRKVDRAPTDEAGRRVVATLRDEALATVVPNPRLSFPMGEFYLGLGGN